MEELKQLINGYLALVEGEENKRRKKLWKLGANCSRPLYHPMPQPFAETGEIPVVASINPPVWARFFKFSLREYYTNPRVYLPNYLKSMIAKFNLAGSITLDKVIPFDPGVSFGPSLFGKDTIYQDLEEPWPSPDSVIKEKDDLNKLNPPDFFKSGLMPLVHRLYQEVNTLLTDTGCYMEFPQVLRGSYALAFQLRGFDKMVFDFADDPQWVHQLLSFITDARSKWYKDRAAFLGEPIPKAQLHNDEVDCSIIGPNIFEEFVLPYEIELSKFHKGITYWHSCGNITPILSCLKKIPEIEMINVSSWTDYKEAATHCPKFALEICIKINDFIHGNAGKSHYAAMLEDTIRTCLEQNVKAFYIRASGVSVRDSQINEDLSKIKDWVRMAKETASRCLEKFL